MKLYNANLSPFASRCRIQIYAKGLAVELPAPPGGLGSAEYKARNPTGKVPALEVDGEVIAESEVICEYLEDRFPTPSLRPSDALERARMRTLARVVDLYVLPPIGALFGQLNPATRDAAVVQGNLAELDKALDTLERFLGKGPYAVGSSLTLADCALVPAVFFVAGIGPLLGNAALLAGHPRVEAWWGAVQRNEHVARVVGELDQAAREYMGGGRS
jgi:glutathione S-transferase